MPDILSILYRNIPPSYLRLFRPKRFLPAVLTIEPTNLCNLRCEFCSSHKLTRKKGMMSFDNFKRLVQQIPTLKYIILFFMGESFLNADIFKMISYAEQNNVRVNISTNSTFLLRDSKQILDGGLSIIEVCLDGLTQDTLSRYRKGADYAKALAGIRQLCTLKRAQGKTKPNIILRFLVFKHNEHQVSQVRKLASDLGVNVLRLGLPLLAFNQQSVAAEHAEAWMAQSPDYQRYKKVGSRYILKSSIPHCTSVWVPAITHDGDLVPCCMDVNADYSLGNVFQESFSSIYWSEKYMRLRRLMWKKRLPLCASCTVPDRRTVNIEFTNG